RPRPRQGARARRRDGRRRAGPQARTGQVKLVDLNVLIYATDETSIHHGRAKPWLERVMSSSETIGIPTAVAVGYLRLTTSRRVMADPLDVRTAVDVISGWYRRSNVTAPEPTARHYHVVADLLSA